jgi:tetratricopeptide (TPR) repeat protein
MFAMAAAKDPTNVAAWYHLGTMAYIRSSYRGALFYYDKALELDPYCITAWYNKGFILNIMGDIEGAVECYDNALIIDPDSPSVLYNKQFALYKIGEFSTGETTKERLDSIDPGFADSLNDRGTRFFVPSEYSETLDYSLPDRWYNDTTTSTAVSNESMASHPYITGVKE